MRRVTGEYDIDKSVTPCHRTESADFDRAILKRTFHGAMGGSSSAELLYVRSSIENSGAFAGFEFVVASIDGRAGTFFLQHVGFVDQKREAKSLEVVPGTGTAELHGIRGTMEYGVLDGHPSYSFEYSLPTEDDARSIS